MKPIYFLVGDKATKELSTSFGIFKVTGAAFPATVVSSTTVTVTLASGASITPLPYAGFVDGNNFVMGVPEPSVALLGALGVLGLVRRRR